jgi:hypothetical protein
MKRKAFFFNSALCLLHFLMNSGTGKPAQPPPQQSGGTREERPRACPACGAAARRRDARFCSTCGRSLDDSYLPADALRASYHLHRRATGRSRIKKGVRPKNSMSSLVQMPNRNGASTTALAFATYAVVPYLGILFCPGAVLMGCVGLLNFYRAPQRGGRRASYASVILGLLILCAQLLLWWILYKVPEWTKGF